MAAASETVSSEGAPAGRVSTASPPAEHEAPSSRTTESSARIQRISAAVLLAFGLSLVLSIATTPLGADAATDGPRLGGDYPAFYGAGSIVLDGDIDLLYDADRQTEAQSGLGIDGYLSFAYPPHVAIAYTPLAALGYRLGYAVHTVLLIGVLAVALRLLWPMSAVLKDNSLPAFAAAIAFYPLFRAVGGGQNTALTVLAFAVVWRALRDDRETVAGVAVGLLLFRPQYALPLMGLLWLAGHRRASLTAVAIGVLTWVGTAMVMGVSWLGDWFDAVTPFVERDAEVNAENSISILGFSQALFGSHPFVVGLAATAVIAVVLTLMHLWRHPDQYSLATRMGAVAAGSLLLSPHTMFYDAGLLVVVAVAWSAARGISVLASVAVLWAAALIHFLAPAIGATPLALVVAAAFVLTIRTAVSARPTVAGVS